MLGRRTHLLSRNEIVSMCAVCSDTPPMVSPCFDCSRSKQNDLLEFGLSDNGYIFVLDENIKVLADWNSPLRLDPKNKENLWSGDNLEVDYFAGEEILMIPPNSVASVNSAEVFDIPKDVVGIVSLIPQYSMLGLMLGPSYLLPGTVCQVSISVVNASPSSIRVYPGEGFGRVLFLKTV